MFQQLQENMRMRMHLILLSRLFVRQDLLIQSCMIPIWLPINDCAIACPE